MSLPEPWAKGFLTGLASLPLMSLVPWVPVILAVVLAVGGAFGNRRLALSGTLAGFGVLWLLLIGSQLATGSQYDQVPLVVATGIVPLVVGLVLAAIGGDS